MVCEVRPLRKFIGTEVALERSLAGVDANVLDQVTLPPEGLLTVVALERAFVCVNFLVLI